MTPVLEGARPLLVEVQALVTGATGGTPRRAATGVDAARMALLLAVLQQRAHVDLTGRDVYVSVAGGIRVAEPGADLAGRARRSRCARRAEPPPRRRS